MMFSRPFAMLVLAGGCVAAAVGGAFMASRQSPALAVPAAEVEQGLSGGTAAGVSETETVITEPEQLAEAPAISTTPAVEAPAPRRQPVVREASPPRAAASSSRPSAAVRTSEPVAPVAERPASSSVRDSEPEASAPFEPSTTVASVEPETAPVEAPVVPAKVLEELVVSADSVLGLQMETAVSSQTAKIEDRVEARVTRDVRVGNEVAIPAGSRAVGSVTVVERGGKVRERARLGIRFHTLVLDDGTTLPIRTETIYREGDSPARESAAKIGGAAIGGAILGGILGGKKGAVLGGTAGAAGGTAVVMSGDRNAATVQSGSTVTVRLSDPVTVTVEK